MGVGKLSFFRCKCHLSHEIALRTLIYKTDKSEDTLVAIGAKGSVCTMPLSEGTQGSAEQNLRTLDQIQSTHFTDEETEARDLKGRV